MLDHHLFESAAELSAAPAIGTSALAVVACPPSAVPAEAEAAAGVISSTPFFTLVMAAHDLKTPTARICDKVERLLAGGSGELPPEQAAPLREIATLCRQMQRIVDDCYSFGRLQAGMMEMHASEHDLAAALREVANIWRPSAAAKQLEFELREAEPALHCCFDLPKLQRIVSNLIDNAVKYTPAGGHIELSWERTYWQRRGRRGSWWVTHGMRQTPREANAVRISVSDTGCGIVADEIEQIFEPFVRLHHGPENGAGLGLAIALQMAKWHNGTITVESRPGEGSRFSLILPLVTGGGEADAPRDL